MKLLDFARLSPPVSPGGSARGLSPDTLAMPELAIYLEAYGDTKLSQLWQELANHVVKTDVEQGWSKHIFLLESDTCGNWGIVNFTWYDCQMGCVTVLDESHKLGGCASAEQELPGHLSVH